MGHLFLAHTGTLKSTIRVAPGTYEPAGASNMQFIC